MLPDLPDVPGRFSEEHPAFSSCLGLAQTESPHSLTKIMRLPWPHHCISLDVMGSKTVHSSRNYLAALFLLLATPLAGWCQQMTQSSTEVLSLDEAINIALQNNRPLKNSRLNV